MNKKLTLAVVIVVLAIGGAYYLISKNITEKNSPIQEPILELNETAKSEIWNIIQTSLIDDYKPLAEYSVFEPNREKTTMVVNGWSVVIKAAVFYKLPTGSVDTETGREIITEGTDYYDYEIIKVNGLYQISQKTKSSEFSNKR